MHTPFCTSQISLHTSQNAPVLALSLGLEIRWTSLRNVRDVIFMVLITWTCRNRSGRSAGCRTKNLTNKNSYTGWPKNLAHLVLCALTSSNIGRFSNLFHCQNQENICNNTVTKDPIIPQVCRYTTLWNANVLKATIEKKMTSLCRPAARRTHWTCDLKTAGCNSYFR